MLFDVCALANAIRFLHLRQSSVFHLQLHVFLLRLVHDLWVNYTLSPTLNYAILNFRMLLGEFAVLFQYIPHFRFDNSNSLFQSCKIFLPGTD